MNPKNDFLNHLINLLYPFIIIFGCYLIIYGDISPGGGFQGGAVLASVFILKYIQNPHIEDAMVMMMQKYEKFLYLLIILIPFSSYLTRSIYLTNLFPADSGYARIFLILMNALIGLKVCLGLTVIFYEFILHERRWSE